MLSKEELVVCKLNLDHVDARISSSHELPLNFDSEFTLRAEWSQCNALAWRFTCQVDIEDDAIAQVIRCHLRCEDERLNAASCYFFEGHLNLLGLVWDRVVWSLVQFPLDVELLESISGWSHCHDLQLVFCWTARQRFYYQVLVQVNIHE